ncbi:MAG TPA: tripartite tricarboxylate transporter substrate-binding protein [Xanthobacteraceae bacterium]|jgi:tripartite-type tricarboxylate transporter receptor subunit TctC
MKLAPGLAPLVVAAVLCGPAARADDVADFYRGRTLTLIAGFNVGGGADAYARIIARHLGAHLPGAPAMVVKNMQGAGSVLAANHIFNVSPRDGSEIGLFAGNIVVDPVIGGVPAKYDARRFNWIGAPASETNICVASPASAFKTIGDTFKAEMVTGTAGTSTYDFPVVLNNVLGTRLKLVKGYAGSAALRLAMERGEIDGFCGVTLDSMRTAGLTAGKANILLQIALKQDARLAGVPFVMDYARREEDRQVLRLVFGWLDLERPLAAPPGTPVERVRALRQGFDEAMQDPALLADAERASLSIEPMGAAAITSFIDDVYQTPPAVAAKAAQWLGRGAQ